VAPLAPVTAAFELSRIHPIVEIAGTRYVILVERLAAIQTKGMGPVVGTADGSRYEITAALDMLFTGI
jgi:hypothetical protein